MRPKVCVFAGLILRSYFAENRLNADRCHSPGEDVVPCSPLESRIPHQESVLSAVRYRLQPV
jgi:hypothetical protein